jgi:hypothetical protein
VAQGHLQRIDESDRRAHRLTHGRVCERPRPARPRLRPRRGGEVGRRRAGDRARRRSRVAHRPRREARGRLRPQGVDAAGRRGAAADRGRLPQRRNRPVRSGTRRTDAAQRGDLGAHQGTEASWTQN